MFNFASSFIDLEATFILFTFLPFSIIKKRIKMLSGFIIGLIISLSNIAECNNLEQPNTTQQLQEFVWQELWQEFVENFFAEMSDIEVDNFGRDLLGQLNNQGWRPEINATPLQPNSSVWTSLFLYIMLSTTIALMSLYHREILDTVFNVTLDLVADIIPTALNGLIPRDTVQRLTVTLLENPETCKQVLTAMNRARELLRISRGG